MADLQAVYERIDQLTRAIMERDGIPGFALAITDRDQQLHVATYGYANLAAGEAVSSDHMFEFGSIGKSFTCIALLQLAEAGKIDLHAPVADYLPWFEVQSEFEPITIHHLMTHSAGITGGSDFPADPRYEVWALRETRAVHAPGEHFHYSNAGYKALGLLLEEVTGQSYADLIWERILQPLGMRDTAPTITHDTRRRLVTGYRGYYDDRPWHPRHGRAPATWFETNTADGCIASTPGDLATYLRMLINGGEGPNGRILSEESFQLMTTPYIDARGESSYGYGLFLHELDGRRMIGHGGGMVGYYAVMQTDVESGFGIITMVNAPGAQAPVVDYALRSLHAVSGGEPLPDPPVITPPEQIENATDYAGRYQSDDVEMVLRADADRLLLEIGDERVTLIRRGADSFLADYPGLERFLLRFTRDDDGRVRELTHGPNWYASEDFDPEPAPDYPPEWDAYPGHYRSHNPWTSNFRIILRRGELFFADTSGGEEQLIPEGDGSFRLGDPETSPEFISFDTIVNGEAWRLTFSGGATYRFFTP